MTRTKKFVAALRRRTAGASVVCLLGAGLVAAAPGTAMAADCGYYVCSWNGGTVVGAMTFRDDGDHFFVWDVEADGHGVRGELRHVNGERLDWAYDGTGADSTIAHFQYDIKEDIYYYLRVCTVDGANDTTPTNCNTRQIKE
ncbi:hypothetical protein FH609_018200 [Streptomyces sp. 3MP-14]|uniref:Fibronectin type III domain-containing protein n=1 Tax=Streptomyces mimosae TaxID=2586635 RepID=A0A5N6A9M9_9ACTN|nr:MULTISPECIES: hypothetical protein [Streptomyces]KAB8164646.1 hypothetical protein FH607_015525 [Streptomyces mimosae]KAB8175562.1 hypothetical protein FH609_018200 [Streptomyces sp. 3MP-14]